MLIVMCMVPLLFNRAFAGDDSLKKIIIPTDVHLSPGQMNGMSLRGETAVGDGRYRTRDDLNSQQKTALDNVVNNPVSRKIPQTERPAPQERVDVVIPNNINLNAAQTGRVNSYTSSGIIQDRSQLTPAQRTNLDYVLNGKPVQTPAANPATAVITANPGTNPGTNPGITIPYDQYQINLGQQPPTRGMTEIRQPGNTGALQAFIQRNSQNQVKQQINPATTGVIAASSQTETSTSTVNFQLPVDKATINYDSFRVLPEDKKLELMQAGYEIVQPIQYKTTINPGRYTYVVSPTGEKSYVPVQRQTSSIGNTLKK